MGFFLIALYVSLYMKEVDFWPIYDKYGEGNGNPLQYSCLENSRDREAWWAAVYRIAQSQTRLKWRSSSGSSMTNISQISLHLTSTYLRKGFFWSFYIIKCNQSVLEEINPEYSFEGLVLKLKLQYFGHLMRRADSLEKSLMLGKIENRRSR